MTIALLQPVAELFSAMRPREVRTMREFAEQEITLPTGPEKGDLFSTDFSYPAYVLSFRDAEKCNLWRTTHGIGARQVGSRYQAND
jgi:hypothetical protein